MTDTEEISAIETRLRSAKLLIVDDEPMNLILMVHILEQAGYHAIQSTSDARKTQALCREFQPDLILLDLMMPHMDGIAVMDQLKADNQNGSDVPIVILTADNSPQTKRRVLAGGAADCITKPLDMQELLQCISDLLASGRPFPERDANEIHRAEEILCEILCAEEIQCAEALNLESLPLKDSG